MAKKIDLIVTGIHRGGTTWMGQAINKISEYYVINEPFNFKLGISDVPRWYLDCRSPNDIRFTRQAFEDLENGTATFKRTNSIRHPLKTLGYFLAGNHSERRFKRVLRSNSTKLAVKDPFLLMMSPELAKSGMKCIVTVRHPAAVLLSLRRMGWHIPNEHLRGRDPAGDVLPERDGDIVAICAFWKGVYRPLLEYLKKQKDENIFITSHENMFRDIEKLDDSLQNFIGLDSWSKEFSEFLRSSTSGTTVQPSHQRLHEFSRNSPELAHFWKKGFTPNELQQFEELIEEEYRFLSNWTK